MTNRRKLADGNPWPYSEQYKIILNDGRSRPAPAFGSPTLVWHFGLWPKEMPGEREQQASEEQGDKFKAANQAFDGDRQRFFDEIFRFASHLRDRGCVPGAEYALPSMRNPEDVGERASDGTYVFREPRPPSLQMTLWWLDETFTGGMNEPRRAHAAEDMRVRVNIQTHIDHATITFYVDVGKPYSAEQLFHLEDAKGQRRHEIMKHITRIRDISRKQIERAEIDRERLPEKGVDSADEARELLEAANYLYEVIWDDLSRSFAFNRVDGLTANAPGNPLGERFADCRGVVFGLAGLRSEADEQRKNDRSALMTANDAAAPWKSIPPSRKPMSDSAHSGASTSRTARSTRSVNRFGRSCGG